MSAHHPQHTKPLIRFLILGDPRYDRRVQNFIRYFRSKEWSVELIYGAPTSNEKYVAEGIAVTHITLRNTSGPRKFFEYHRALLNIQQRSSPANILFACDLYSLRAASQVKKSQSQSMLIYDAREIYTELPTVEKKHFVKAFWKWWEKSGLSKTDLVVTTAPLDANALMQVHSFLPRSSVVKNMPYSSGSTSTKESLRHHFNIPGTKKIIVYVGGLQADRGLEKTILAISKLKDDAVLVLIGDGVLKPALQKLVDEKGLTDSVFFYGSANADDVVGLLSSADVGVSLIEGMSLSYSLALPSKVFEYLHAGLVVVSSPLKQVQATMMDRDYVLYADEHNESEVIAQFQKALLLSEDISLREKIISDAKESFVFEHDAEELYGVILSK